METVLTLMEQAEIFSNLIADAILKKTSPVQDDLSEREAKKAYGTRWLMAMKAKGLADAYRIRGKWVYSRHQLDCLRAAERQHAQLIFRDSK
jgi:hypothetical protein